MDISNIGLTPNHRKYKHYTGMCVWPTSTPTNSKFAKILLMKIRLFGISKTFSPTKDSQYMVSCQHKISCMDRNTILRYSCISTVGTLLPNKEIVTAELITVQYISFITLNTFNMFLLLNTRHNVHFATIIMELRECSLSLYMLLGWFDLWDIPPLVWEWDYTACTWQATNMQHLLEKTTTITMNLDEIIYRKINWPRLDYSLLLYPSFCSNTAFYFCYYCTMISSTWLVSYCRLMGLPWNFSLLITFEPPISFYGFPLDTWICNLPVYCNIILTLFYSVIHHKKILVFNVESCPWWS